MARYWCVNFDAPDVLRHGLEQNLWAMQYQYSFDGHLNQGGKEQVAATTRNWRTVAEIEAGDWLVAYLKRSMFYAVGEVIEPRQRPWHPSGPPHEDSIERTVTQGRHRFPDGVVRYTGETLVFYEDFMDPWDRPDINRYGGQPENWKYPQRIDVQDWQHKRISGVNAGGLAQAAPFPLYRQTVFEIPQEFFERIRNCLQAGR